MKKFWLVFAIVVVLGGAAWWWFGYQQLNDATFTDVWVKAMDSGNANEFYTLIGERGWTTQDIAAYTLDLLADKPRLERLEESIMERSRSACHEFMAGYLPSFMLTAFGN